MKSLSLSLLFIAGFFLSCQSQTNTSKSKPAPVRKGLSVMATAANKFIQLLSDKQKEKTLFHFDDKERYDWHYIPKSRNGIPLKDLTEKQRTAAMALLRTALSDTGYKKTTAIIELENVLRAEEGRPANDEYRDPTNYLFSIFGDPARDTIWGWRFEGHHISFHFSSDDNRLISGTPGFLGSNPAVVLSGPEKGKYVLKDETELGFALLHTLTAKQLETAIISNNAPGDIVTASSRKAMIQNPKGILYSDLDTAQRKAFLQLLSLYIHRYTPVYAADMMHDIEDAGLNKLQFAWAGAQQPGVGHPHYYRIQGPTIIIEYDNTQNNANHIHTVVRDLKKDFGGDQLLEHYQQGHHHHD